MHDEFKHVIADKHKVSSILAKHFENQFQDGVEHGVDMFEGSPITAKEVETAFVRRNNNNNRVCGYGLIPADMFKEVFEKHLPLEVGTGILIAQQKPGKPLGPLKSLRPIMLLTLSLITLHRISDQVNDFLSPS